MTREEIFNEVKAIIVEELGQKEDNVTLESNLETDFGADSLDAIELVCSLEDKFGIKIPDEEAMALRTVKQLVDFVEEHQN